MTPSAKQKAYWKRTLRLTAVLLAIWFLVTFVVSYFARELNEITIFGFPLGFYMGGQGALLIYVLIVGYFARRMNYLDEGHVVHRSGRDQ